MMRNFFAIAIVLVPIACCIPSVVAECSSTSRNIFKRTSSITSPEKLLFLRGGGGEGGSQWEAQAQGGSQPYSQQQQGPSRQYPTSTFDDPSSSSSLMQPPLVDDGSYDLPDQQDIALGDSLMHETVQERLDSWKQKQMEFYAASHNHADAVAVDEYGRKNLLASVSKGSRAIVFVLLLFRNMHWYELADQKHSGMRRLFLVVPVCLLFIGNLAGVVSSITSPSSSTKKRLKVIIRRQKLLPANVRVLQTFCLAYYEQHSFIHFLSCTTVPKAILNLDKLVEAVLILFSFLRLTILPSPYTTREIYIASIFHSLFFIIQCQAFTKLSWDEQFAQMEIQQQRERALEGVSIRAMGDSNFSNQHRLLEQQTAKWNEFPSQQR